MKKILCFGDSNTFGYNPKDASRFESSKRWAGILKDKLFNHNFKVIEAGLNNRKCFIKDPEELCGFKALPDYLNEKLDFIILGLGINDVQKMYKPNDSQIKTGIINLINLAKRYQKEAKIIILSPSNLNKNVTSHHYFSNLFDDWSVEKSKEIFNLYNEAAGSTQVEIIDLNKITPVSNIDGLHYDEDGHKKIAEKLYNYFVNLE